MSELPDPLDRLEEVAEKVATRAQNNASRAAYESGNRFGLLWVHAGVGMVAGMQMLLFGTATQIEAFFGSYARLVMGPLALVGGFVLAWGLTRHPRAVWHEATGLFLLASWDLCMTIGLAVARFNQHYYQVLPIGQAQPRNYVPAYPVSVYGGMLGLLFIHLLTLRFVWRQNKEEDDGSGTD
jgi:hypothetical protein